VFVIKCHPPITANLPNRQQFLNSTQPDHYQPRFYLPAHHDLYDFLPLITYHPPTIQLAPTMAPRTRLTTLFRALLAHLYIRRSPVPAPTPEERTQITYDPIEYSCSSGDSVGSDDIPWAEHARDGSDNTAPRGKPKAASI